MSGLFDGTEEDDSANDTIFEEADDFDTSAPASLNCHWIFQLSVDATT